MIAVLVLMTKVNKHKLIVSITTKNEINEIQAKNKARKYEPLGIMLIPKISQWMFILLPITESGDRPSLSLSLSHAMCCNGSEELFPLLIKFSYSFTSFKPKKFTGRGDGLQIWGEG
jgi:hypothetical protein